MLIEKRGKSYNGKGWNCRPFKKCAYGSGIQNIIAKMANNKKVNIYCGRGPEYPDCKEMKQMTVVKNRKNCGRVNM
jgi:hypothetical protein